MSLLDSIVGGLLGVIHGDGNKSDPPNDYDEDVSEINDGTH